MPTSQLPSSPFNSFAGVSLLILTLRTTIHHLGTGASAIVLILSDDSLLIENWQVMRTNIQPQVWVSIFSTVTNVLLDYALAEGLTIVFW